MIHQLSYKVINNFDNNKTVSEETEQVHCYEQNEAGIRQAFERLMRKVEDKKINTIMY